ncbi:MAG TPA: WecB/TagA/CpsF family glycosyltransferase [Verrucomicrobiae bacterium]
MSFTAVNARRAGWIFLAGTVLVCGLAITARSLWIDEIEIARRAQQPTLADAWRQLCAIHGSDMQMPLYVVWIWACAKIAGHREMSRVYGPDLMLGVCAWSETSGAKHFFYGGADGVAELLAQKLQAKFPKLAVVGTFTPPFRALNADEEKSLAAQVRAAQPDILWVGLSTPKQEKFMAEYLPKLGATVMIGVGAAFDFHSGRVQQAPRWLQRSGLEWLYRLGREPRRLAQRYFRNNPLFVLKFSGQLAGLKKYPSP